MIFNFFKKNKRSKHKKLIDEKVLGKSDKEKAQVLMLNEKMKEIFIYCVNTHVKPFIK